MLTTRIDPLGDDMLQVVVEKDGAIVGCCHLFTAVHWDAWWIHPDARTGPTLKALITGSLRVLQAAGLDTVYTGVEDARADVAQLLEKFGFTPAPGRLYLLKVTDAALRLHRQAEPPEEPVPQPPDPEKE